MWDTRGEHFLPSHLPPSKEFSKSLYFPLLLLPWLNPNSQSFYHMQIGKEHHFLRAHFLQKKKKYIYIHIHIYNGHVSWLTVHCEYFLFPLPLHSRSVICHNESSPFGLKASTEVNSWWNLRYWMLMYYDQFDFVGIKWNWVGNYFKYYF